MKFVGEMIKMQIEFPLFLCLSSSHHMRHNFIMKLKRHLKRYYKRFHFDFNVADGNISQNSHNKM
jgi:hypothetical protein